MNTAKLVERLLDELDPALLEHPRSQATRHAIYTAWPGDRVPLSRRELEAIVCRAAAARVSRGEPPGRTETGQQLRTHNGSEPPGKRKADCTSAQPAFESKPTAKQIDTGTIPDAGDSNHAWRPALLERIRSAP
ncbi:hypothetical protein [Agromyces larvae]|uniref:Uncharacterized protein n=1 Tax=Agromyces larvae TaxID=2929802 RepID=A0ABY4C5D4_9MICO|nr:hypothetical protein [Agromyces larvae]UOE45281.1 hypothetical protein MTO99_05820 [Agromyces larvae]